MRGIGEVREVRKVGRTGAVRWWAVLRKCNFVRQRFDTEDRGRNRAEPVLTPATIFQKMCAILKDLKDLKD